MKLYMAWYITRTTTRNILGAKSRTRPALITTENEVTPIMAETDESATKQAVDYTKGSPWKEGSSTTTRTLRKLWAAREIKI